MKYLKKYKTNCRLFDGYKPCLHKREDCINCAHFSPKGKMICLINLDAMGDVLMTTALLKPIKRKHPQSCIIWVTSTPALPLLENNPLIDKIMTFDFKTYITLKNFKFDLVLNVDKSVHAASFAMELKAGKKKGYKVTACGAIVPFSREAEYAYQMGLDDNLKFRKNKQTGRQILAESFGLEYKRDEYILNLDEEQIEFISKYKKEQHISDKDIVVGFNTGCSGLYPNKKFNIEHIIHLCRSLHKDHPQVKIALFGGRDEKERNKKIEDSLPFKIINTPVDTGLKKGIALMNIADIICTCDTLGMHIGIGLKKKMVVWFNITCSNEIDLYGPGEKIISSEDCSPCWKGECKSPVCLKNIDLDKIYTAIKKEIKKTK